MVTGPAPRAARRRCWVGAAVQLAETFPRGTPTAAATASSVEASPYICHVVQSMGEVVVVSTLAVVARSEAPGNPLRPHVKSPPADILFQVATRDVTTLTGLEDDCSVDPIPSPPLELSPLHTPDLQGCHERGALPAIAQGVVIRRQHRWPYARPASCPCTHQHHTEP